MAGLFDSTDTRPLHFLGIGGAGMSALAQAALRRGVPVTGCDPVDGAFADLERAGATLSRDSSPTHLTGVRAVVATAAAPEDHPELVAARAQGVTIVRRKHALAELVNRSTLVALAGTHGKTTTTVMTTLALDAAGFNPSGLAGGRVASWGGNAFLGGDDIWVVEADEYDQALLTLMPDVAVINNVEADHLECYGSLGALHNAFAEFANKASTVLLGTADSDSDRVASLLAKPPLRFGLESNADLHASVPVTSASGSVATLTWPDATTLKLHLTVPGVHNLRNAVAALGVVKALGGDLIAAAKALADFDGVGRRFERLGEASGIQFVDDYAHHPTELVAALAAARQAYPHRRLVAVFQPHLYSRTRELGAAMGRALAAADLIVVTDIYPAREEPIPGVTAKLVEDAAREAKTDKSVEYIADRMALLTELPTMIREGDLVLTLGAGDITEVGRQILKQLDSQ